MNIERGRKGWFKLSCSGWVARVLNFRWLHLGRKGVVAADCM